jgi:hypothetical protein
MKSHLDMNKIARGLRAKRKGKVSAASGCFRAMQLMGNIDTRFRVPASGARATDPVSTTSLGLAVLRLPAIQRCGRFGGGGVLCVSGCVVDTPPLERTRKQNVQSSVLAECDPSESG